MKKDLKTLAGLNPFPTNDAKGWSTTPEGRQALEGALSGGDRELAEPSVRRRLVRPWAIAVGAAAVTLVVLTPLFLRSDPGGPVGGHVLPTEPSSTTTSTTGTPSGPSPELLAYLLPISGAEVASVNYISMAGQHEFFEALDACMNAEGFDLDFEVAFPPDFVLNARNEMLAYDSLQKYGFLPIWSTTPPGFPPGEALVYHMKDALDGFRPFPDGVDEAEAQATFDAHQGCSRGLSDGESAPMLRQFDMDHEQLGGEFVLSLYELDLTHPDIVEALEGFRACVRARGWEIRTLRDGGWEDNSIDPYLGAVGQAVYATDDLEEQQEIDARAVRDLVECIGTVEDVRQPLRAELRERYVDENWAALMEAEARFTATLKELGVGTHD